MLRRDNKEGGRGGRKDWDDGDRKRTEVEREEEEVGRRVVKEERERERERGGEEGRVALPSLPRGGF